jgi:hypothetical protein
MKNIIMNKGISECGFRISEWVSQISKNIDYQ